MTRTWADQHVRAGGPDSPLLHLRRAGPLPMSDPTAPPVVVLHDAGAETVDAPAWDLLADRVAVVQVLLPGVGDSPPPPADADLRWTTDLLRGMLARVWRRPGVLVGTSLGGWFAIETALADPTAVAGLVLLDTAGLHTPAGYLFGLFAAGQGQDGQDGLIGPLMARHRAGDGLPAATAYVTGMTAAALHSWNPHTPNPSLLARCAGLQVPTHVLWGRRDALIPLAHGHALVAAIGPAARLRVLDGGHLLAIDAPAAVAGRVADLALPSGPPCPSTSTD